MTTEHERFADDRPDLDPRMRRLSRFLQALSPELAEGSEWPDARAGGIMLSFEDGSEQLRPALLA
jgi:hypothetical protein